MPYQVVFDDEAADLLITWEEPNEDADIYATIGEARKVAIAYTQHKRDRIQNQLRYLQRVRVKDLREQYDRKEAIR